MPVTAEQIRMAIEKEPDISAVFLTSPNYEGLAADYREIKKVIGDRLLIVDEAHGAICYFSPKMPETAIEGGADVAITSMHKSLGCLIGASLLNVNKNSTLSTKKVMDAFYCFTSTSPNILMMASCESAVKYLAENGEQAIEESIKLNTKLRDFLSNISNVVVDDVRDTPKDPIKTFFKIKSMSG